MIDENDVATLELTFDDPGTLDYARGRDRLGRRLGRRDAHRDRRVAVLLDDAPVSRRQPDGHDVGRRTPSASACSTTTAAPRRRRRPRSPSRTSRRSTSPSSRRPTRSTKAAPISLDFTFDDPGTLDTHTYQIDWGDGHFTTGAAAGHGVRGQPHLCRQRQLHGQGDRHRRRQRRRHGHGDRDRRQRAADAHRRRRSGASTKAACCRSPTSARSPIPASTIRSTPSTRPTAARSRRRSPTRSTGATARRSTAAPPRSTSSAASAFPPTGRSTARTPMPTTALYTVTVTVMDDDMGEHQLTFQVNVINVDPTLTGHEPSPAVLEGQAFTLTSLGVGLEDPGFDNPANAGNATNGGETEETFTGVDVDWGDGTAVESLGTTNRVSGSPGVFTTADFTHAPHTYADNGTYTVTLRLSGRRRRRGDAHVHDRRRRTCRRRSRSPTDPFVLNEGQTLTISNLGTFTDPGLRQSGQRRQRRQRRRDRGDCSPTRSTGATARSKRCNCRRRASSGSPGVLTAGTLADSHFYADNDADNKYTITVTLSDDDGGVDVKSFEITVFNVNPTLQPVSATDVNANGQTTLTAVVQRSRRRLVRGAGRLGRQARACRPSERFVVETVHAGPTPQVVHAGRTRTTARRIRTTRRPTSRSRSRSATTTSARRGRAAGREQRRDRRDHQPRRGQQVHPHRHVAQGADADAARCGRSSGRVAGDRARSTSRPATAARSPARRASRRSPASGTWMLTIINPDGTDRPAAIRLPPKCSTTCRACSATCRTITTRFTWCRRETEVKRLVIEVFVRNGRLIDPGDDTEGARDRPPTDEAPAAPAAEPARRAGRRSKTAERRRRRRRRTLHGRRRRMLPGRASSYAALRHGSTLASVALALSAAGTVVADAGRRDARQGRSAKSAAGCEPSATGARPNKPR